jgi:hypothetical protein
VAYDQILSCGELAKSCQLPPDAPRLTLTVHQHPSTHAVIVRTLGPRPSRGTENVAHLIRDGLLIGPFFKMIIEELDAEETKLGWYKGRLVQAVNVPAHDIQLRAAEMILELCNAFPGRR